MKKTIALIGLVGFIAGCGGGGPADILFKGTTPATASYEKDDKGDWKDERHIVAHCPSCRKKIDVGSQYCSDQQNCGVEILWNPKVTCGWCKGTKACNACVLMEQTDGNCANCKGEGVISFLGESKPCPNCKDTKKCPICKGSMKCDACNGEGTLTNDQLKSRQKKKAPEDETP